MEQNSKNFKIKFQDPSDKDIYFDTLNEAILTKIEGKLYKTENTRVFISDGLEPLINSQMRLECLKSLGRDYENVYFTYIPAKEYNFLMKKAKKGDIISDLDSLLLTPLIKLKEKNFKDTQNEFLSGCLSGKRSIIMFTNDNFALRLKGCGNNYIGFNLSNVDIDMYIFNVIFF